MLIRLLLMLICSVIMLGSSTGEASTAHSSKSANLTIFIYHKFGEPEYPTTNVSLDRFEEQLAFLRDNNYRVISLRDVVTLLQKSDMLPEKTVVITIDDGYLSTYTGAWPLLKRYGYPFTVFLYLQAVDHNYRNYLSWEQVKEMRAAGVDFQDHTYSHYRLGSWPTGGGAGYRDWIRSDLERGRAVFTEHLGVAPEFLALPYGEYNTIVIEEARKVGYKAVFNQDPGSVSRYTDVFQVPREPILGNDWASMRHFAMVAERNDLPIETPEPMFTPLVNRTPPKFCATLMSAHLYAPRSLGIYVSEWGWLKPELKGKQLCVENPGPLTRRSNRVAIRGRDKATGRSAIHYWLLINPRVSTPAD